MAIEIKLPVLGENVESATVVAILVSLGDKISEGQSIVELDTEKASVDLPASASGTVGDIRVKQGDTVKVGQVILTLEDGSGPKAAEAKKEAPKEAPKKAAVEPPKPPAEVIPAGEVAPAAPSQRRMARELGVDINEVAGTGPDGRISEGDVRDHARSKDERKPMSAIRRKTAEHLQKAWSIPHVTHFDSADITELEELRVDFAGKADKAGGKLTLTAIVLKVAAAALKRFPQFNASLDLAKQEILYKKHYNVGVAVDTERGLLVPVIRDIDRKNILELSIELTRMGEKARNGKLGIEEMQGGTFTVTNLGGIGGTNFTPIINSPEVAILGLSRASHQAVFRGGEFQPRLVLPLAVSFDHRVIDGADAARFLRWIAEALEQPFLLSFEG